MANEWICKECGQDSSIDSENCEICDAPRATAEVKAEQVIKVIKGNTSFEVDGEKIDYVNPIEKELSYGTDTKISDSWKDIVRIKKEQGL